MSCEAVHEAMKRAADRARNESMPTFLEIKTYRYKGHSMSDPAKYRTREEVDEYRSKDPIERVLKTIQDNNFATPEQITQIDDKIKEVVEDSVRFAEESPWPEVDELYKDIYIQQDYPFLMDF
jgi:pyruvate dehydrogenase E1 component alpha subunit